MRSFGSDSTMDINEELSGRREGRAPVPGARTQVEQDALTQRDRNGVAVGADAAVQAASGGSGQALPGELRAQFEGSVGQDLSSVRVHNDASAHAAASAVGARAYTVGQDIYFGSGQFDASSGRGQQLLAHEVAHTVQQHGASTGVQGKMEVSTPHDALEVEADVAADQMLIGGRAELSRGVGVQRKIMRDATTEAMDAASVAGGAAAATEIREHPPAVTTINIDGGASQARRIISDIRGYEANMSAGVSDGTDGCVTQAQYGANHTAVETLEAYISASQDQGSTLGQFQAHAERLRTDYARLQGQVAGFNGSAQGAGAVTGDMGGRAVADAVVTGASGGSVAELQSAFRDANSGGNPAVASHYTAMQRTRTDLQRVSAEVATRESNASAKEARARAGHATLVNVVASQSAAGIESQIAGLRSAAAAMKEKVDLAAGMVKSVVTLGTAAATGGAMAGPAVAEGVSTVFSIAGYLASHAYDADIANLDAQLRPITAQRDTAAITAAKQAAIAGTREWQTAGQEYVDKIYEQQRLRSELNTHMRNLGEAADRSAGGNSFAIITQILSTAEQYLAQSRTTIAIGRNEELRAAETTGAAAGVNAPRAEGGRQPLTYYRPHQFWHIGAIRWGATQMTAYLYHEGREAGNRTVRATIEELERKEQDVQACTARLNQVFGA